jgi:pentatricopeptide repeat protein
MSIVITNTTSTAAWPQRAAYFTLRTAAMEEAGTRKLYGHQITQAALDMIDRGEKLAAEAHLRKSFERSADAAVGNMLISVIGKNGYHEGEEEREKSLASALSVFRRMRAYGMADSYTYNSLMHAYSLAGMTRAARNIFEMAVKDGKADLVSYKTMIDALYRAKMYGQILRFIKYAPEEMKGTEDLRLSEIECLRKLRIYDEALDKIREIASDPLSSREALERALVNGACCMKEMGRVEEAVGELRRLLRVMDEDSRSKLRAMSLLVLWGGVEAGEAPAFREEIARVAEELNGNKGGVMGHYQRALEVLDGMLMNGKAASA